MSDASSAGGWCARLAGGAPPELVRRAVRLAAAGWAAAELVQRAVAELLDAGVDVDAAAVLAGVERLAPKRALPGEAAVAAAGRALVRAGARVLLAGHHGYPPRLADAWPELGAPVWLFGRSRAWAGARLPDVPAAAVVGTRHPSLDGLHTARELGRRLARHGVLVVSGMARGIDQAAHRGALDAGGSTVGVLGAGLDVDYPRGDAALRSEVVDAGALLTEHACGAPPRPRHFLARNRIISGLADLTVVVEGRGRSGSLQTARLAASQGRDVWAVPGSINAPTSRGPLGLIRDGAAVVTRLDDVLEAVDALPRHAGALPPDGAAAPQPHRLHGIGADGRAVLGLLGPVPATPGALAAESGLPMSSVLAAISELAGRGLAVTGPRGVAAAHHPATGG